MKKEDAIFRLQSIDNYLKRQNDYSERDHDAIMMAVEALKEQRPHGEWEKYGGKIEAYDIAGHKTWGQKRKCTNCGFIKTYIEDFGFYSICPTCGASMLASDRQVTGKLDERR